MNKPKTAQERINRIAELIESAEADEYEDNSDLTVKWVMGMTDDMWAELYKLVITGRRNDSQQ